jgi:hypothetical protein
MNPTSILSFVAVGLFVGMLAFSEIGRRIGLARRRRDPEGADKGIASAEAAVFGLLGLLIAFTFSGAASRFEDRRHLITTEANAIGTAWLRLDLLPADAQPDLRTLFRTYVDTRASTYRNVRDEAAARIKLDQAAALQAEIWNKALTAIRLPEAPAHAAMLVVPALNEMFDITTTRMMATRNHPPLIIFALLAALSLIGATLVGFDMSASKDRPWLHTMVFAGIMALAVYVIMELEFPRYGLIRVDVADEVLVELRNSMR